MITRRTRVGLALVVFGGWTVIACTAGVGSPPDIGQGYGDKPGAFGAADKPGAFGAGNAAPGQGPPAANGAVPAGGGAGAGGSAGGAGCPACDVTYECSDGTSAKLKTVGGQCQADGVQNPVVITCDGKITQGGTQVGTWTALQGGAISVVEGTTKITCAPGGSSTPPGTATAVPTTVPSPPQDAGTKG
jgi:hypothetical protein